VLTLKTVAADGKESTVSMTFKDDGKPYAMSGNPEIDTVSKDGTLTFAQKGTHVGGVKFDAALVYDRQ
jgi:hypothetical protein